MENWDEAIDMLSATHAFDQPQGGVSIDNRIIKAVAALMSERDRYREALMRYGTACLAHETLKQLYRMGVKF